MTLLSGNTCYQNTICTRPSVSAAIMTFILKVDLGTRHSVAGVTDLIGGPYIIYQKLKLKKIVFWKCTKCSNGANLTLTKTLQSKSLIS